MYIRLELWAKMDKILEYSCRKVKFNLFLIPNTKIKLHEKV
jgi:hypothetical protein